MSDAIKRQGVLGLLKQMSGQRPVTRQTELFIAYVERGHSAASR